MLNSLFCVCAIKAGVLSLFWVLCALEHLWKHLKVALRFIVIKKLCIITLCLKIWLKYSGNTSCCFFPTTSDEKLKESFFDSAVSLSISVCVCLSPGSFFYSDSGMNNSKWLGKFTWSLNYHLCFSSGVFSPYPLLLLSLPLLLLGWISHHCFLTPSYRSKLPQWSVSQYMMSSASLSHLFKLWQLQRLVSSSQSSHASLDAHTSTLQTLWNSRVENKQV